MRQRGAALLLAAGLAENGDNRRVGMTTRWVSGPDVARMTCDEARAFVEQINRCEEPRQN